MRHFLALVLFLLALNPSAIADPITEKDLPPILRSWVPWVLDQLPDYDCVSINQSVQCLWPGRLTLSLHERGGQFTLDLAADKSTLAPLPFSEQAWPQDVKLDGAPAPVVENNGAPAVAVEKGSHRLEGRYEWNTLPPSFLVSPLIAVVDLTIDGNPIDSVKRDDSGLLWIKTESGSVGAESLKARIFNKITDGIPILVESRLKLDVTGPTREIEAESVLPPDAVVVSLGGDLPVHLEKDGRLKIQVRAGTYTIFVKSRLTGNIESLILPGSGGAKPDLWVFEPAPQLRQVQITGGTPVDPNQTDLPEEWKSFQAFEVSAESGLSLKEIRRGEMAPRPDEVSLHRTFWLDLNGKGYTIKDVFTGTLGSAKRFNLQNTGKLGHVKVNGEPRLITNPAGVELRDETLDLTATSRLEKRMSSLQAVGWTTDVAHLATTLNLPPGWMLIAAGGVDEAPEAWTKRWTLLGFFFVLILTLGFAKVAGHLWGLVALFFFTLTYGIKDSPFGLWLFILATLALLQVLPAGWFQKMIRIVTATAMLFLVIMLIPFAVNQIRTGLFPQTEWVVSEYRADRKQKESPPPAEYKRLEKSEAPMATTGALEQDEVMPGRLAAPPTSTASITQEDPQAVIQTGPAIPDWAWKKTQLAWSGPVSKDQKLTLWLLSPGANLALTLLRLMFLGLLLARLGKIVWQESRSIRGGVAKASLVLIAALTWTTATVQAATRPVTPPEKPAAAMAQGTASAAIPDASLLEELKNRLTRPAACAPNCVATSRMQISVGETMIISAYVQVAAKSAWALPGPVKQWSPKSVRIDGKDESALATLSDGFTYLRLPKGAHQVVLSGPLPSENRFALQFAGKPHRLDITAPGWDVAGVKEDGTTDGAIEFSRKISVDSADNADQILTPWILVTRRLNSGVTWEIETTVERLSPTGSPLVLEIPLLTGEKFTSQEFRTVGNNALINLGRDETGASWTSPLDITDTLSLETPAAAKWSEVWIIACGVGWQCEASGLSPASRAEDGELINRYYPWPGEKLDLAFVKTLGVTGATTTIERVDLKFTPGLRLSQTELNFDLTASRAGLLHLTLPKNIQIQKWVVDNEETPASLVEGKLPVSHEAGAHHYTLTWQTNSGLRPLLNLPVVEFDIPLHNIHLSVELPANRWLLITVGPKWGPAILFWGYFFLILVTAFFLGRNVNGPLPLWQWLFLGLGLTQIPATQAVIVALWFFILRWRERYPPQKPIVHNLVQTGVVLWTIVTLFCLYDAVHHGLLFAPDMQVMGNGSAQTLLNWTLDRTTGATPQAWVVSVSLWFWRGLMLLWSLWLAISLIRWLSWGWSCLCVGGIWRKLPRTVVKTEPPK